MSDPMHQFAIEFAVMNTKAQIEAAKKIAVESGFGEGEESIVRVANLLAINLQTWRLMQN